MSHGHKRRVLGTIVGSLLLSQNNTIDFFLCCCYYCSLVSQKEDEIWAKVREEVAEEGRKEPLMQPKLHAAVLSQRTLEASVGHVIAHHLSGLGISAAQWTPILIGIFEMGTSADGMPLRDVIRKDLVAVNSRDPACPSMSHALLFFKVSSLNCPVSLYSFPLIVKLFSSLLGILEMAIKPRLIVVPRSVMSKVGWNDTGVIAHLFVLIMVIVIVPVAVTKTSR